MPVPVSLAEMFSGTGEERLNPFEPSCEWKTSMLGATVSTRARSYVVSTPACSSVDVSGGAGFEAEAPVSELALLSFSSSVWTVPVASAYGKLDGARTPYLKPRFGN